MGRNGHKNMGGRKKKGDGNGNGKKWECEAWKCEAVKMEGTWNKTVKVMYDLPYATHRWIIEPVSDSTHVRCILINRFLNFLKQIKKSSKIVTNMLL